MKTSNLRLSLLGPPKLERSRAQVRVARRKVMALLAYLAVDGTRHSRDQLAELLYPRLSRDRARAGLRLTLNGLRAAVGVEQLDVDRACIGLRVGAGMWVDLREFRRLTAEPARSSSDATRMQRLERAAGLIRGGFLQGFYLTDSPAFEEWQRGEQEKQQGERAAVLDRLIALHESLGSVAAATDHARTRLTLDELDEAAHRKLMALLAASGNRAAALRQYEHCRELLRDALREEPDEETERLHAMIVEREPARAPRAPATPLAAHGNLKTQPTPFIGRETELAAIRTALGDPRVRLLTLIGPGGVGKTRLALEVASKLSDCFPDGVWLVDLSPIRDPDQIAAATAEALGVREAGGGARREEILVLDYLAGRHLLLLLDTLEHLVAGAPFVAQMLEACPRLVILATSRRPLRVRAEHEMPVLPMQIPRSEGYEEVERSDSVRLFLQRGVAGSPAFILTRANASVVAAICVRLEGLPLAIELAASQLKLYPPEEILRRLQHRYELLRHGSRDLPERQRELRTEMDWSFALLEEAERSLMGRLTVFAGGWTQDAAEAVCLCENLSDPLMSLVDHSLVTVEPENHGTRYRMLQSVRDYAVETLAPGEAEGLTGRFVTYCINLAELSDPHLRGPEQTAWLERLDHESGNLRAALSWFRERGLNDDGARLAGALGWYWFRRGRFAEGRTWLGLFGSGMTSALPAALRARVLFHQAWTEVATGRTHIGNPEAASLFRRSLALAVEAGDGRAEALAAACLAWQLWTMDFGPQGPEGDLDEPKRLSNTAVAVARESGDSWVTAFCLRYRVPGYASVPRSIPESGRYKLDLKELERDMDEAVALAQKAGDRFLLCLTTKGRGDVSDVDSSWLEALAMARDMGDLWSIFEVLKWLPGWFLFRGDIARSRELYGEGLRLAASSGARGYLPWFVGGFDYIARSEGRTTRSARLWAAAAQMGDGFAKPCVPEVWEKLGLEPEAAARAWDEGQSMTLDEVVHYALSDD